MTYILRLGQIQKKIENLQEEIDTLEGGNGGGSGSGVNAEVQAAINELQDDLDDLTSQYTNLLSQYSNISNTVTTIDSEVNTLQSDLDIVETLHTDLNNEVTIIGNELDTLETSYINLSNQYTTLNTKTTNIQNDLDTLEASHITLQSSYTTVNNKANSIQSDLDTLKTAFNLLNSEVDTLEASHITLQSGYTTLNTTTGTLGTNLDTLRSSHITLQGNYTTINSKADSIQADLDTLESSHVTLQGGYSTLVGQYNTLNTKATNTQNDLDTLEASHVILQSGYTTLNNKVTIIDGEVDTLQSGYTALDTQLDALEIEVDNLIASINSSGVNWSDITPATIPTTFNPVNHNTRHIPGGTDIIPDATTTISGLMSNVDKTKLNGIANSATANSTDTFLLNRANHTGTATTINTNAVERSTSGTLNLGATATNTTIELGSLSTVINVGTGNVAKTINIGGHASDILNITGSVVSQNVTNTNILDKLVTLNKGGAVGSGDGSGYEIEEGGSITSYFNIGNTRNSFMLKTPARSGILRFTPSSSAFTHEIITANTANRTFTLPDADINLNSQTQNLVYASPVSSTGAMSIRSLVGNDIPLATNTTRGAVSKETSGTFTPVLEGGTTPGSSTYNARTGTYYLIGKICVATIYIELATTGGMAGNATISGLPFTTASGIQSAAISQYAGVTFTAGYTEMGARIEASNTKILLFQGGSGVSSLVLQTSAISASFVIALTATYVTV